MVATVGVFAAVFHLVAAPEPIGAEEDAPVGRVDGGFSRCGECQPSIGLMAAVCIELRSHHPRLPGGRGSLVAALIALVPLRYQLRAAGAPWARGWLAAGTAVTSVTLSPL